MFRITIFYKTDISTLKQILSHIKFKQKRFLKGGFVIFVLFCFATSSNLAQVGLLKNSNKILGQISPITDSLEPQTSFDFSTYRKSDSTEPTAKPTVNAPTGVMIRGPINISSGAMFTTFNDLFLQNAEVSGSGELRLKANHPQKIHAFRSTIACLTLDNPTQVSLTGDLKIENKLSVKNGVFDVRQGKLKLKEDAKVELMNGATILHREHGVLSQNIPSKRLFIPELEKYRLSNMETNVQAFVLIRPLKTIGLPKIFTHLEFVNDIDHPPKF